MPAIRERDGGVHPLEHLVVLVPKSNYHSILTRYNLKNENGKVTNCYARKIELDKVQEISAQKEIQAKKCTQVVPKIKHKFRVRLPSGSSSESSPKNM